MKNLLGNAKDCSFESFMQKRIEEREIITEEENIKQCEIIQSSEFDSDKYKEAIEVIIDGNLRLIMKIAHSMMESRHLDEVFSDCCLGMIRAAEKFDSSKNCKFSSYAMIWMKQFVMRCRHNTSFPVSVPQTSYRKKNEIHTKSADLREKGYSDDYIASELGINLTRYRQMVNSITVKNPAFLIDVEVHSDFMDSEDYNDSRKFYSEYLSKSVYDNELLESDRKLIISNALKYLSPVDRGIIEERFGLTGFKPKSYREISLKYGVTSETIRLRQNRVLKFLKEEIEKYGESLESLIN